ncbi:uncharacterized protein G2W53_017342 [Senna tora]|uniref:Uncharacterized protein n=1 Tax=Senna tora TaxID=362788 RepID=A0A834TPR6_9FABA|nr:uncharacterized protein G2W53_017342 [Senna tora]
MAKSLPLCSAYSLFLALHFVALRRRDGVFFMLLPFSLFLSIYPKGMSEQGDYVGVEGVIVLEVKARPKKKKRAPVLAKGIVSK